MATDYDEHQMVVTALEAFARDSQYMADLAGQFLKRWFASIGYDKNPPALPAEFLLELSAVIRIAHWQRAGLTTEMGAEFPPAAELLEQLLSRLLEDPLSFCLDPGACPAPLQKQVVMTWFRHCSWTATSELGSDVVVNPIDEDLLLDALADLLWQHRSLAKRGPSNHDNPQEE
jgi:hypothetical protein